MRRRDVRVSRGMDGSRYGSASSQGRAGPTRENRRGKIRNSLGKQENKPDSRLWGSEKSDKMKLDN